MRRWDGFVSVGGGAAAAERLLRANRLAEIDRQLPALEQAVAAAEAVRDTRGQGRGDSPARGGSGANLPPPQAERAGRDATRAGDSAAAALERLDAQRAGLGGTASRPRAARRGGTGSGRSRPARSEPRCPIPTCSRPRSRRRAPRRRRPERRSPIAAPGRPRGPAKPPPTVSATLRPDANPANGAPARCRPNNGSPKPPPGRWRWRKSRRNWPASPTAMPPTSRGSRKQQAKARRRLPKTAEAERDAQEAVADRRPGAGRGRRGLCRGPRGPGRRGRPRRCPGQPAHGICRGSAANGSNARRRCCPNGWDSTRTTSAIRRSRRKRSIA